MSAGSIPLVQEQPARSWAVWSLEHRELGIFAFLLLLAGAFALTSSNFATLANANTIALNASILVVVACAETVVVLTRNFDLLVGSIVALSSYVGLDIIRQFPEAGPLMVLAPVAIGGACGAFNGLLVAVFRIPSVIATLGTLSIFRGLAYLYASGQQINAKDLPQWVLGTASLQIAGVSLLVLVALAVVAASAFLLQQLRIGRQIYAIGSNPEAAAFYGLNSRRIVFFAYLITGLLTGLGAFLFGTRAGYVVPYLAQGLELTALAAVVLGGVSVLGGSGTVIGAAIGAITLATLDNGLVLLGASEFTRQLIQGLAIILAVVVNSVIQRRVRELLRVMRWRRT
jgi:rhamnose transport system permease protein